MLEQLERFCLFQFGVGATVFELELHGFRTKALTAVICAELMRRGSVGLVLTAEVYTFIQAALVISIG
jgi:hypothetical protein